MADTDQLYLVQWEDRFMSVISARDIVFPLKKHYQEGELIKAKFQKKTFQAAICEIHPNRKFLLQQSKLPPKHPYESAYKQYLEQQQKLSGECGYPEAAMTTTDSQSSVLEMPASKPLCPAEELQRVAAKEQKTSSACISSSGTSDAECINLMDHSEDSDDHVDMEARCWSPKQQEEAGPSREEFNQLMDDVRSLRRRVRKLESQKLEKLEDQEECLFSLIESCDSEFEAVEKLLLKLFDIETIVNSSVSGKRANSKVQTAKKPLDFLKILKMRDLLKKKFPNLKKADLTARIHSVQKKLRRQQKKI